MEVRIKQIENGYTLQKEGREYYYSEFVSLVNELSMLFHEVVGFLDMEDMEIEINGQDQSDC